MGEASPLPAKALLALAMLSVGGCSAVGLQTVPGAPTPPRVCCKAYYEVLDRYTWSDSVYEGVDPRLFIAIVWEAAPLRKERAAAIAELRGLSSQEEAEFVAQQEAEADQYVEFILSAYTGKRSWNDFSSKRSIWKIELLTPEGGSSSPLSIEWIARPDANEIALYPFVNRFAQLYRIRFAATREDGSPLVTIDRALLRLRISSAVALVHPKWGPEGAVR